MGINRLTARHQRDRLDHAIELASGLTAAGMFAYGVALSYSVLHAIAHAEEVHDPAASDERGEKPRLLVESCNPDQTVAALRELAGAGGLYDRGVPVRLAFDHIEGHVAPGHLPSPVPGLSPQP